jgi:16S rRNA G966 N2-methylase RsmD
MSIQEIAATCLIQGEFIILPKREGVEIPRKSYEDFKKLITDNLGEYKNNAFSFPFPPQVLLEKIRNGEKPSLKKERQYFSTPKEVAYEMFNVILPLEPLKILEPSAGQGALIEALQDFAPYVEHEITAIELDEINAEILRQKGIEVIQGDFLYQEPMPIFDVVYMNPPFNIKGNKNTYLRHIEHAISFLNEYGSLVSVVPSSMEYSSQGKEFMKKHGGYLKRHDGNFKSSGTSVSTLLYYMTKEE